jgi:hypothetical protein
MKKPLTTTLYLIFAAPPSLPNQLGTALAILSFKQSTTTTGAPHEQS